MKGPQYLIFGIFVVGIGLLVAEYYITKWRLVLGGLGVNLLAASVVLFFTQTHETDWSVVPLFIGGAISSAIMLPIVIVRFREVQSELGNAKALLQQAQQLGGTRDAAGSFGSGITLYARNYSESGGSDIARRFHDVTQRDFGDYARHFVLSSPAGSTFKVLGIDWTELFGAAVSGTSERYTKPLFDRRTNFRVILLDPRTSAALEKRLSEYDLSVGGKPRYERNFPFRVYGKILGSVEMLAEYHKNFPDQVKYKFIPEVPAACLIMNGKQMLVHPYTRSHKGWDSPVFVAEKTPDGIYSFYEEYFDFLWSNPSLRVSAPEWAKKKLDPEIANHVQRFRSIIRGSCTGEEHTNCEKLLDDTVDVADSVTDGR